MYISKEAAQEFGIYDGEEMTCYLCGKVIFAAPPNSENIYYHYGICDECDKNEKQGE